MYFCSHPSSNYLTIKSNLFQNLTNSFCILYCTLYSVQYTVLFYVHILCVANFIFSQIRKGKCVGPSFPAVKFKPKFFFSEHNNINIPRASFVLFLE